MLVRNVYYTYMTTTPTIENNNLDRGRTPAPGPHNNPNKGPQTMNTANNNNAAAATNNNPHNNNARRHAADLQREETRDQAYAVYVASCKAADEAHAAAAARLDEVTGRYF
jgi:hypothetical protein